MIKYLKFVPIQLTFFLIIGIITGFYIQFDSLHLVMVVSFLLAVLLFFYRQANKNFKPSFGFSIIIFLLSFFVGISSITYKNQLNKKWHYSNLSNFSKDKPVLAVLCIGKILKSNDYYSKYEAVVMQIGDKKAIGKILVNIQTDSVDTSLRVDDKLVVRTRFKEIQKALNPFGFDYNKYLENKQIHHQIQVRKDQLLMISKKEITINGMAATLRKRIIDALIAHRFKNDELGVINALLLGQRNSISANLRQSYSRAGAIHILAISGLHIGIILLILTTLFKPIHSFKYGKNIALFLVITVLWMYAIIAGLSASVVRAVTMFTAVAVGMSLNRPTNVYNTLVISMFILLLFNPFYLFEVGFQLSYIAVFAIVWIQPKLYGLFNTRYWLFDKVWKLITVSMAAQIGVLPLSLYYFHQFPGLFFLSNLVIIPFLGIILVGGLLVVFFALIDILPIFLGSSYGFVIFQMNNFVRWISGQESFLVQNISYSFELMISTYLFVFLVFIWVEKQCIKRILYVLMAIIVIQLTVLYERYKLQTIKEFIVFNKVKESLIAERMGSRLVVSSSKDAISNKDYILNSYMVGSAIYNLEVKEEINLFRFKNETILVVDSLVIYKYKSVKPSIIILQNSPKVNLERLLKWHRPKIIIADGSNYRSYVERWSKTCINKKTPFHNTLQKGAFILKEH